MEEVLRRTSLVPLASPCFVLRLIGVERELLREALLDYQGVDRSIRPSDQKVTELSVPWSLRPRNRAAAATCGRGRCKHPAILRLTAGDFQRKTKGATTKGQNRFGTFSHFFAVFHTFSPFFSQDFS